MKLSRHIERLLLHENIVVVPDFGCFVAHELPARYDASEHTFSPACRILGFTTKGVVNDYMLVESYIDNLGLSLPDAIKELDKDVQQMKKELYKTGSYTFEGLGTLTYSNNEYDFQPEFPTLLSPTAYGLSLFQIDTLQHQTAGTVKNVFAEPENDPVVITIRRSTLQKCTAAAAVLAIALLSVAPMRHATQNLRNIQTASLFSIPAKSVSTKSDTEESAKTYKLATKHKPAAKAVAKTLEPAPDAPNAKFTIVLAGGFNRERATLYADSLKSEGINADITGGNHPQVVFGRYATSQDAKDEIAKHSSHPRFSVAWIRHL